MDKEFIKPFIGSALAISILFGLAVYNDNKGTDNDRPTPEPPCPEAVDSPSGPDKLK